MISFDNRYHLYLPLYLMSNKVFLVVQVLHTFMRKQIKNSSKINQSIYNENSGHLSAVVERVMCFLHARSVIYEFHGESRRGPKKKI